MRQEAISVPAFVIKAEQLATLNYLPSDHPRPIEVEWINRGTDQRLRQSSIDMLLRTLFKDVASPSVVRLHRSAGLRVMFKSDRERDQFASAFANAQKRETDSKLHIVTAIFDSREHAEQAVFALKKEGIPEKSVTLLWRASQFIDTESDWPEGHSKLSIAGATAGGGVAGAMLGVAILAIPGVGPVAAAGALAATAFSSVAAVSGIIGATGGAVARMLTDFDVDSVSASYYEQQIKRGKVFVSVDTRIAAGQRELALDVLKGCRGRSSSRA